MVVKKKAVKKKAAPKKKAIAKKAVPKKAAVKKKPVAKKPVVKKKPVAKKKAAAKKSSNKKTGEIKTAPKKPLSKRTTQKEVGIKKNPSMNMHKKTDSAAATNVSLHGIDAYKEKRGEIYMNPNHSAHFRNILNNWKTELMEEVDRTVHHMQDEAANFPDPNDRASQESEFALELRTRDRERKLIKKIDESLTNLESSDYGYCDVCGIEIGIRRLEARPTATQCIDCKTLDEIREKQPRG